MEPVTSKNLFHYKPRGKIDEETQNMQNAMKKAQMESPEGKLMKEMLESNDPDFDDQALADMVRKMTVPFANYLNQKYEASIGKCTRTDFKVPLRDGNDFEVPVLVHTPNELVGRQGNPAVIYAHGGGVVAGDAAMFAGGLCQIAVEAEVVIFNVDYRLAPEARCPKNALDFYCTLKHIKENAESLGVDPEKIAIAGDSGGGYICFATMVMLAQKDEGHLVKLAIPGIPMISDYCFSDPAEMTTEERENVHMMRKVWKCIASDFELQRSDPLLFPAKASDELLSKMPPTIIWENEFDMFITEATRMAHRMRAVGRLLEFRVQPGQTHMVMGKEAEELYTQDYKLAIKEYLLS